MKIKNKYIKEIIYISLSAIKALGASFIILASLLLEVFIINYYIYTPTFNKQYLDFGLRIISLVMIFKMIIFFATWLYLTIVNYKEISKE